MKRATNPANFVFGKSTQPPSINNKYTFDTIIDATTGNTSDYITDAHHDITPELIESEFHNILSIHDNQPTSPTAGYTFDESHILSHKTHLNGSFRKTKVFRDVDDTFITFDYEFVHISPTNLSQFWRMYEKYKNTFNIIIDSRLQLLIMYATLAYADELLVYNTYTTRVVNLYTYCSDLFKIAASELNIQQIQELFLMKMIISYYLQSCSIQWQVNQIISNIKELHKYTSIANSKSIIDIMMNYIKCGAIESYNRNHIITLFGYFHDFFGYNTYRKRTSNDIIINQWKIENLTIEEVYITFMLLKQSNFIFVKNDNM